MYIRKSVCQEIMNSVGPSSEPTYTDLAGAVETATLASLPKKRAQPGLFRANSNISH